MNQLNLFDGDSDVRSKLPRGLCDPLIDERDKPRLSGQCMAILERLQRGPATNAELAALALKYTSRISDLRKNGYRITAHRGEGGTVTYQLENHA